MAQPLDNNDREALVIRWKTLLRLRLLDIFYLTQDYNKIVVKEILDMEQAVLKSFAARNGISLPTRGFPPELVEQVIEAIPHESQISFREFHEELNGLRDKFRNPETHELSLPMPPPETVDRCCRRFRDIFNLLDPQFITYVKNEALGFARLMVFYYEIVSKERISYRDETKSKLVVQLKRRNDQVEVKTEKGKHIQGIIIDEERSPDTIVRLIESGVLDTEEFRYFVESSLSINE